jgi:hypothetical protein
MVSGPQVLRLYSLAVSGSGFLLFSLFLVSGGLCLIHPYNFVVLIGNFFNLFSSSKSNNYVMI